MRYTAETIADYLEDGAALAGAIEGFEATIALMLHGLDSSPVAPADGSSETLQTAAAPGRRAAPRPPAAAARRRSRHGLLPRDARPRHLPARGAGGRLAAGARGAVRSLPLGDPHVGDARRGQLVRLRQGPARIARGRRDPRAGRVRLRARRRCSTCRGGCRRRSRRASRRRWRSRPSTSCGARAGARSCCSRATPCCGRSSASSR